MCDVVQYILLGVLSIITIPDHCKAQENRSCRCQLVLELYNTKSWFHKSGGGTQTRGGKFQSAHAPSVCNPVICTCTYRYIVHTYIHVRPVLEPNTL